MLNVSYTQLYGAAARPPSLLQVSYTSPSVIMSFVLDVTSELRRTCIESYYLYWLLQVGYTSLSVVMCSVLDVNKKLHHTVSGHVL